MHISLICIRSKVMYQILKPVPFFSFLISFFFSFFCPSSHFFFSNFPPFLFLLIDLLCS
eukprot:UN01877